MAAAVLQRLVAAVLGLAVAVGTEAAVSAECLGLATSNSGRYVEAASQKYSRLAKRERA
jgi:hypothetical protein